MLTPWTIYWVTRMDALGGLEVGLIVLGCCATFILYAVAFKKLGLDEDEVGSRYMRRWAGFALAVTVALAFARVATPTSKEAAAIIVIPAIANSEQVQGELGDVYDLAKRWLRSQVEEDEADKPNDD